MAEERVPRTRESQLRLSVSWGIRGDMLNVEEISSQLGMAPSHSWQKGEEYTLKDGRVLKRPTTVWQLRSAGNVTSDDLGAHAEFMLQRLETKAGIVDQLRRMAEYSGIRIRYELEAEGSNNVASFCINANLFRRLAALATDINFSVILKKGHKEGHPDL